MNADDELYELALHILMAPFRPLPRNTGRLGPDGTEGEPEQRATGFSEGTHGQKGEQDSGVHYLDVDDDSVV